MRIFTASFATETNTFSPVPTDRTSFETAFYAPPGRHPETPTLCSAVMLALRRRAQADPSIDLVEGIATWAEPGGLLNRAAYESLRDEMLDQLRAAVPVDGVVLGLHGAMVAEGYDDCEGDLLERVRALAGCRALVAASLDPHSHLTPRRVAASDILAAFQEFPHTDFETRGAHVADLALRALRGEIRPRISTFDCRMIDVFPTNREPMRGFVDRMKALEGRGSILSVSFIHGFMAGDVREMGARMLVVTDNDPAAGAALADRLGREVVSFRGTTRMPMLAPGDAIDRATALIRAGRWPVVLADVWDNPGGGVAGDGTIILRELLARGMRRVGVATIWDPVAVSFARAAGVGAEIALRIAGKCDATAGAPLDLRVKIRRTADEAWQSFGPSRVPLGAAAVVRVLGTEVDILLNTNRTQTFDPDVFSGLGVDPSEKDLLLVKSTNHFQAGFARIAAEILYVDAGGPYPSDPRRSVYRKLVRPIWPQVSDPWT